MDYYRAMTDAVAETTIDDPARLVWIMNEHHRAAFRHHMENDVGTGEDGELLVSKFRLASLQMVGHLNWH